jgi:tripartite-type tricarboxylate transporter receptor subunit TctC
MKFRSTIYWTQHHAGATVRHRNATWEHVMQPARTMVVAIGLALAASQTAAQTLPAQSWPAKPVRAVVPFAAGSSTDIVPRLVLEQLAQQLGQPIVVENRPGAGGTIGAGSVAKAEPDGYTILASGSAHTISPALYPRLNYHPGRDFAAVVPLGISSNILVVAPTRDFKTVADLVAAGKARPGSLTFSSVGVGTATHLSAERFRMSAGLDALHVPFKGGAEAMSEVIAGRVDFFFGPPPLLLPHVKEGKLKALVVNGTSRMPALPDIPTTREAGFDDAEYPVWFGLFVPARTPRDIVERLHQETLKALQAPKVRERMASMAVDPLVMTPDEFDAYVDKEIALNATLVQKTGIRQE